jgi:hypothetical protein
VCGKILTARWRVRSSASSCDRCKLWHGGDQRKWRPHLRGTTQRTCQEGGEDIGKESESTNLVWAQRHTAASWHFGVSCRYCIVESTCSVSYLGSERTSERTSERRKLRIVVCRPVFMAVSEASPADGDWIKLINTRYSKYLSCQYVPVSIAKGLIIFSNYVKW